MARRQMKVFGGAIATMLVALALALLGVAGILPLPFGNEFSRNVQFAEIGDTPCPTEDAVALSPGSAELQVLNSSSVSGLAGSVAEVLEEAGYSVPVVDNGPTFRGNVQIEVGPTMVDQAYTLARFFEAPVRIKLQNLTGSTVTIILGETFQGVPTQEDVEALQAKRSRLVGLDQCLPVDPKQIEAAEQSGQQSSEQSGGEQSDEEDTEDETPEDE